VQAAPATNITDGFEAKALGPFWARDRFAPGTVTLQGEIVHGGHGAVRIVLHGGDVFEAGKHGNADSERDELREADRLVSKEGLAYEQAFSLFFPADFPIVPTRLVVAQWKQYCGGDGPCSDDSPVLAVRYIGGELLVTQDLAGKQTVLYHRKAEYRNRWLNFRFRVRFSQGQTGRIEGWLNGEKLVEFSGVTANAEAAATGYKSPGHFYFKMGLYRNVMAQPMTLYIDDYSKRLLADGF
jgi:hypothetical protein